MIICLSGPPAAGKSTFAAQYILRYPEFTFCSIDAYRVEYNQEDLAWNNLSIDVIEHQKVILESCGTNWRLEELLNLKELNNRKKIFIGFSGNHNDLTKRLEDRQHKRVIQYKYEFSDEIKAISYVKEHLNWRKQDLVINTSIYNEKEQLLILTNFLNNYQVNRRDNE